MSLPDYPTFLANVNENDLAMLTTFTVGVSVNASSATEADALFVQAQRLAAASLIVELHRVYTDDGTGVITQSFTGKVSAPAAGYLAKLARERVVLSRLPLP